MKKLGCDDANRVTKNLFLKVGYLARGDPTSLEIELHIASSVCKLSMH